MKYKNLLKNQINENFLNSFINYKFLKNKLNIWRILKNYFFEKFSIKIEFFENFYKGLFSILFL